MKKVITIAAIALVAMAYVSCEKTYTCECKYTNVTMNPVTGDDLVTTWTETGDVVGSKREAKDECLSGTINTNVGGYGTSIECELK